MCVCVYLDKLLRLLTCTSPAVMVPTVCIIINARFETCGSFAKNARVEIYDDNYISRSSYIGHLCGSGEHQHIVFTYREAKSTAPPDSENE